MGATLGGLVAFSTFFEVFEDLDLLDSDCGAVSISVGNRVVSKAREGAAVVGDTVISEVTVGGLVTSFTETMVGDGEVVGGDESCLEDFFDLLFLLDFA